MKQLYYFALILFIFISCKNDNTSNHKNTIAINPVVFDGINSSIKPGDDFFHHIMLIKNGLKMP